MYPWDETLLGHSTTKAAIKHSLVDTISQLLSINEGYVAHVQEQQRSLRLTISKPYGKASLLTFHFE